MADRVLAVRAQASHLPSSAAASGASLVCLYEAPQTIGGPPPSTVHLKDAAHFAASTEDDEEDGSVVLVQSGVNLPGAVQARTLHLRVYETTAGQLIGACNLAYEDLLSASLAQSPLELPLLHPLSPLDNQSLRQLNSSITLTVRTATAAESSPERTFEKSLELMNGDAYSCLPKELGHDETTHRQLAQLHISTQQLPPVLAVDNETEEPASAFTFLAALFEKDLHSGTMRLQAITPWTRPLASATPADQMRFPGAALRSDYFPGEQQLFQLSLYRIHNAGDKALSPDAFGQLKEENRVGSAEFTLDSFGLESQYQLSKNASSSPLLAGRLSASSTHATVLHLDLPLTNDVDLRLDGDLKSCASIITASIDTSLLQLQPRKDSVAQAMPSPSATHLRTSTKDALAVGTSLDVIPPPSFELEQSSTVVSDAADVDVSAYEGLPIPPEVTQQLIEMVEVGQTFRFFEVGVPARRAKLFYRGSTDPTLPGLLYSCDVDCSPRDVDVSALPGLDLCTVSDIFLGKQAPAFHSSLSSVLHPDNDDSISFSLVTATSASLNLEARSPQQRAAWIAAIMELLKQEDEEGEE